MIAFEGHVTAYLKILDMGEFDVMIGMDWLSTLHATLCCVSYAINHIN